MSKKKKPKYSEEYMRKNLAVALAARGINQAKLAELIDSFPSTISHFTTGRRVARLNTFVRICNALEISPDQLLSDSKEVL